MNAANGGQLMRLDVSTSDSICIVRIRGSVGIADAEAFRRRLQTLAAQPECRTLLLDLSEMDFICSLGLGAMISAQARMRQHEGRFVLVNPQRQVNELLDMTRLNKLFVIQPTLEAAGVLSPDEQ